MSIAYAYDVLTGIRLRACTSGAGMFYPISAANAYQYNILSGQLNWTSGTIGQCDAICLLNSASALCASNSTTSLYLVELAAGYAQTYTGGLAIPNTDKGQQMASDGNGTAMVCTGTTDKLVKFNNYTVTQVIPTASSLASTTANTIINKSGTSNFIIGTANGKIIEIDGSANTVSTFSLPTSNNVGTTPTLQITGLSYYNGNLLVMTNFGIGYQYNYAGQNLLNKFMAGSTNNGNTVGTCLCDSACGVVVAGQNITHTAGFTSPVFTMDFNYNPAILTNTFFNDTAGYINSSGIDPIASRAWVCFGGTADKIRVFTMNGLGQTSEQTRIQSNNIDVSGRILRINVPQVGMARVEQDVTVSAGTNTLSCAGESTYIELALTGTPNVNEQGDIRIIQT